MFGIPAECEWRVHLDNVSALSNQLDSCAGIQTIRQAHCKSITILVLLIILLLLPLLQLLLLLLLSRFLPVLTALDIALDCTVLVFVLLRPDCRVHIFVIEFTALG